MTASSLSAAELPDQLPQIDWITDPSRVARLSQDFAWFSPVLKRELGGKVGEVVVRPRTEDEIRQVVSLCARQGVRLTELRRRVLELVWQSHKPLGAYDILAVLSETDGRRATVAFTDDWAEDAARRDFTINALYASASGEIFDYATGVEDLIAGKVRFMGDARVRIAEDYLRVLRLFRFQAWYGRGEIDAEGLSAAAEAKGKLKTLSAERIAKELLRLLEADHPGPVLRVMAATGILPELLPEALQLPRLERLAEMDAAYAFPRDAVLRLAALLPDDEEAAHAVADRLRLSNADRARLELALGGVAIPDRLSAQEARRLLYRLGTARFRDKLLLQWAAAPAGASADGWRQLLDMAEGWQRPRLALTGRDVMQAGVPEGPEVGRVLAKLEDWWVEGDFAANENALRARLQGMIGPND